VRGGRRQLLVEGNGLAVDLLRLREPVEVDQQPAQAPLAQEQVAAVLGHAGLPAFSA
jgi:hypothetical protein